MYTITNPATKKVAIFTTRQRAAADTPPCASDIEIPASDGMKYAVNWKRQGHIDTRSPAKRARMLAPVRWNPTALELLAASDEASW